MGTAQRGVSRKKTRGWGRGERNSLFSSLFFSRSLPSRSTPLSERLEQATSGLEPGYKVHGPVLSSYGSVNSRCTHRPTSSPGRFSLALGAGRPAPPPKPGKSALGTRLPIALRAFVGHLSSCRSLTPCVPPSRAPVLSFARYFQAPATQAIFNISPKKIYIFRKL